MVSSESRSGSVGVLRGDFSDNNSDLIEYASGGVIWDSVDGLETKDKLGGIALGSSEKKRRPVEK
jgi:hypothetical protein